MKKAIRRKMNVTTLFHLGEIACLLMCMRMLSLVEFNEDETFIMIHGIKAIIYLTLIPVIQTIGAEVTRQLHFRRLLKKRNVMRFISEIHMDAMKTR